MIDQSSIKNALARHSFMSHSRLIFIILLYLVAHQTIWLCIHKASAKLHSRSLTRSWGRRKRVNIKLNNFSTPSTKDKISSPTCIHIYTLIQLIFAVESIPIYSLYWAHYVIPPLMLPLPNRKLILILVENFNWICDLIWKRIKGLVEWLKGERNLIDVLRL